MKVSLVRLCFLFHLFFLFLIRFLDFFNDGLDHELSVISAPNDPVTDIIEDKSFDAEYEQLFDQQPVIDHSSTNLSPVL